MGVDPSAPHEVLGPPGSALDGSPHGRLRRLLLGTAGIGALAVLAGHAWLVRDGTGPADVVKGMYRAQQKGDCETVADSFHYQDAEARAIRLDVCRRASRTSRLVGYEVTDVEESPKGVAPVVGATALARVGYTLTGEFDGTRGTVSGTWVVAKYGGDWLVPLPQ